MRKRGVNMERRVADLHMHSTASDGIDSPVELVRKAAKNGICAIAITDHDTILGIQDALSEANTMGVEVIPGVEFSVEFTPVMHILGLFLDINNLDLICALKKVSKMRLHLISKSFRILRSHGITVTPQEVMRSEKYLSLKNLTNYLVNSNVVTCKQEANILLSDIWAEWHNSLPSPAACISLIHACGGIAIIAHPQLLYLCDKELKEVLTRLSVLGLDGIEVIHPEHQNEDRRKLNTWACELNLIVSGGSDYHGKKERDRFPTITSDTVVSYIKIEQMKALIEERKQC